MEVVRKESCDREHNGGEVLAVHGATGAERGSGEQQLTQPRQTDGVSSLLELGVVRKM